MDRRARYQGAPWKLDVVRRGQWTEQPEKARPPSGLRAEVDHCAHGGVMTRWLCAVNA